MDVEFHEQLQQKRRDPFPTVPAELKERKQWVVWRLIEKNGKPTKVPFQPNGKSAKTNDPQSWTDFQSVCSALGDFDGIGFVFTADDPYTGVDVDNCIGEDGKIKDWAVPIVDNLKAVSYAEVSPSGLGIKALTRAFHSVNKHTANVGDGKIEVYDKVRYFTVTGKGKGEIQDGQSQVYWVCEKYLKPKPKSTTRKPPPPTASRVSVEECLRLANRAANAYKFNQLFKGNISQHGSHSEADAALCAMLAFYSQDTAVIDSIFRKSGLMREKWDEKHSADSRTYGEMTIGFVLDNLTSTYTPPKVRLSPTPPKRTSHRRRRPSGRFPLMMKRSRR